MRCAQLPTCTKLVSEHRNANPHCTQYKTDHAETIGDAYVVVSGAPEEVMDHAERMADMALGMVEAMTTLLDPSTGSHLQIRVGKAQNDVVWKCPF